MDLKAHLKTISELAGPSGYEDRVRDAIADMWRPLTDSLEVGKMGSLVGLKRGSGPVSEAEPRRRLMLCAHMDEIGAIVKSIDQGFLRISPIGGIDLRTLIGKNVLVHGQRTLKGVIGAYPLYTLPTDQQETYPIRGADIFVDLGMAAEEVAQWISIGDTMTLDAPMIDLQNGRVAGKAFDDRACVAAVTGCLDMLQSRTHTWDVLAVASTREEVGSLGARGEAFRLQPDLAIALDVTFATQPGVNSEDHAMGIGPALSLGANFHPVLYDAINAAAERLEMTLDPDPLPVDSNTDAQPIQISRDGIPTALLNIPIRNMHSTVETVDVKDIERTSRVLAEFIAGLTPDFLATVKWD